MSEKKFKKRIIKHIIECVLDEIDKDEINDNSIFFPDIKQEKYNKLVKYIDKILNNPNWDLVICSECYKRITEEEINGKMEARPYGKEFISTGYKCSNCGNEEKF